MICEKCQKEVNDSANFCPYCGYKFKETNTKISNSKGLIAFLISIICIVLIFIIVKNPLNIVIIKIDGVFFF